MQLLQRGDKIQIVAPARKISLEELQPAIDYFRNQGVDCYCSDMLLGECHQFSGTDEERARDFQQALDNPEIKAVVCARGGYGALRIIDKIDFSHFKQSPKWICGYSDVTVFHTHINNALQLPTLHCTMPINMTGKVLQSPTVATMWQALTTGQLEYQLPIHNDFNRCGQAKGTLIGGNLSLLYAVSGSVSDIQTDGKILFIEDLDEYLYHLDRMMLSLKRSGKLSHLTGLLIGGMSDMHDNTIPFGKTAKEIIYDCVKEYDYPVCFDFPAGHIEDNRALILGGNASMEVSENDIKLKIEL